jgi:hypothetical protein
MPLIASSFFLLPPHPELHEAADGLGAARQVPLLTTPIIQSRKRIRLHSDHYREPGLGRAPFWCSHDIAS